MTVPEIVAFPAEAVQRLYQTAGCPTASDAEWGVLKHFEEAVAALGAGEIPVLSAEVADRLPHHSLVRFYGMVQDLLNPEYYVGAIRQSNGQRMTSKFCDPELPPQDDDQNDEPPVIWERRPVMCVPIPGLSRWALPAAATARPLPAPAATAAPARPAQEEPQPAPQPQARAKRERSSDADAPQHNDGGDGDDADERGAGAGAAHQLQQQQQQPAQHPQLQSEPSMDTDLAGDQGDPMALAGATGAEDLDSEAARPRVRRREDRAAGGGGGAGRGTLVAREEEDGAAAAAAAAVAAGAVDHPCGTCGSAGGCAHVGAAAGADMAVAAAAGAAEAEAAGPSAGEVPGSCMVYMYDSAPSVVLHEVVEVVGILSHMPQLAALEYDGADPFLEQELAALGLGGSGAGGDGQQQQRRGEASMSADRLAYEAVRAAHPPTSQVMRLHAVIVRRAPPLVPPTAPLTATTAAQAPTTDPAAAVAAAAAAPLRDRALCLLRWALGGDRLAAEYVLLQLLSRVTGRGDPTALGHMALNLSRCPAPPESPPAPAPALAPSGSDGPGGFSAPALAAGRLCLPPTGFAACLQAAISCLVPLSVALPLSVEACSSVCWAPVHDFGRERTCAAPLQLAPGTSLLLDETGLAPGQLGGHGVISMQALLAIARQQELPYDFESHSHPVPVDLPLLVLTREGRSLLRDHLPLNLPLNATQPFPTAAAVLSAPAADLPAVRSYLAAARSSHDGYQLADGMAAVLEQYFVDERRAAAEAPGGGGGGGGMTAEEFHAKLTLARLLVLSHGEVQLTRERWQEALRLEHSREARLRVVG